jgi:hypothetical protein
MYLTFNWSFVSSVPSARKTPFGLAASLELDSTFSSELEELTAGALTELELTAGAVAELDAGASPQAFGKLEAKHLSSELELAATSAEDSAPGAAALLDPACGPTSALEPGTEALEPASTVVPEVG